MIQSKLQKLQPVLLLIGWGFCVNGFTQESINPIITKLNAGEPVIGTFTRAPRFDLDFIVIDEQYSEVNFYNVEAVIRDLNDGDGSPVAAPIIRTPLTLRNTPEQVVPRLIDAGAYGFLFPDVETKAQANAAVTSMQQERDEVWLSSPDGVLVAMIMIESRLGIENLDEIMEVPGVGVLFVGPTDMATSIGAVGPNAPEVESMVQEVVEFCIEHDVACGYPIVATSAEDAQTQTEQRLAEGFKVLAVMTRPEE